MKTVKIIGCGGYGGLGLIGLLLRHPGVKLQTLVASAETGKPISALYPHLAGFCDLPVFAPDDPEAAEPADLVFFATPDGVGQRGAAAELARGSKVVDFSGDFRFTSAEDYAEYARRLGKPETHAAPELLAETVYGLPETNRAAYRPDQRLVGNPGCFATSCLLGAAPAVAAGLVDPDSLLFDCKSGISGAGKKPNAAHHYPARYDNMNAYKLAGHQHVMEIERNLADFNGGKTPKVLMTTQVVPLCRGILTCVYGTLAEGATREKVLAAYRDFYAGAPFARVYGRETPVGTATVRGSNCFAVTADADERTGKLRIVSHIDNLMKGQSGAAVQNMNILLGFPETTALAFPGDYP
ncbi:MAG: N-acetyl-gamma-glutamyl-phosphate reductase [Kiritimatiellae bacterium]|nr:N-acetyl-gamma-glutamyl-phosphate reductase [Kiritimatiellia bacterium]